MGRILFQSPSLRGSGRFWHLGFSYSQFTGSFNPLHCGAVVASRRYWNQVTRRLPSFNPLHCGAVVASRYWIYPSSVRSMFQSPSLRGSGRFSSPNPPCSGRRPRVSIPFIAGQWSLPGGAGHGREQQQHVSIPFIAGQWSLLGDDIVVSVEEAEFQSPSLRGSGRFSAITAPPPFRFQKFQSPSLRGSGRFLGWIG